MIEEFNKIPVQVLFTTVAVFGGVARYLNSYVEGKPFKASIFAASAVVAGFSGWMFALLGESLQMPTTMLFIMSGLGGFFGEQTLKFILEYVERKV